MMGITRRDFLKRLSALVPGAILADKLSPSLSELEPVELPASEFTSGSTAVITPTNISDPIGIYLGNGEVLVRGIYAGDNVFEGETLYIGRDGFAEGVSTGMLLAVDEAGQVVGYGDSE